VSRVTTHFSTLFTALVAGHRLRLRWSGTGRRTARGRHVLASVHAGHVAGKEGTWCLYVSIIAPCCRLVSG
jgi:hypothetical protein